MDITDLKAILAEELGQPVAVIEQIGGDLSPSDAVFSDAIETISKASDFVGDTSMADASSLGGIDDYFAAIDEYFANSEEFNQRGLESAGFSQL